eukprot:scaffold49781_cov63-Phaeocystis_antarctica.AAC.3
MTEAKRRASPTCPRQRRGREATPHRSHWRPQDAAVGARSARLKAGNASGEAGRPRFSSLSQQRPGQTYPTHGAAMTGARARKVAITGPTCSLEELEMPHCGEATPHAHAQCIHNTSLISRPPGV